MAKQTDITLRNQMIYSIYVRNHTQEGTFRAIEGDLNRIRALGTDIIWFLPIHPIGVKGKKGSLGCPYAIADYREVNPAYGTKEDFIHLADAIHARGMKVMIDVVYNHTSQDSRLLQEHPEYFYHKPDGSFGNRCGEWADVFDLDYAVKDLWQYQIDTLKMWAQYVDGFRCDVASCVPADFWSEARAAVEEVHPGFIWLAESVHDSMVYMCRENGLPVWSDNELFQAFDMEYQYDIILHFDNYFKGTGSLGRYLEALNQQETIYPANYIKMRYLENHDTPRICSRISDETALRHWLAFMFFQKGTMQIYAGQEYSNIHTPSLFEIDRIDRSGRDISPEITALAALKKRMIPTDAMFLAKEADGMQDAVEASYRKNGTIMLAGYFSLKGQPGTIRTDLSDGVYENQYDGSSVIVCDGKIRIQDKPLIVNTVPCEKDRKSEICM